MKSGISMYVEPLSVQRTTRNMREFSDNVQKMTAQILTEAGYNIQADAKRNVPVKYGVLKSSIYVDNRKKVGRSVQIDGQATQMPRFPQAESQSDGMDVIIGSLMEYAMAMEMHHPTKSGFLVNAHEKHAPRAVDAIDRIIQRQSR